MCGAPFLARAAVRASGKRSAAPSSIKVIVGREPEKAYVSSASTGDNKISKATYGRAVLVLALGGRSAGVVVLVRRGAGVVLGPVARAWAVQVCGAGVVPVESAGGAGGEERHAALVPGSSVHTGAVLV
jgi:hypothetical protein